MIESIRSYIRLSRLAKALYETQLRQYNSHIEALRECNRLYRAMGKTYSIVKHQKDDLFWVVCTRSAKALALEGHTILSAVARRQLS
ncbi:hypothetical protein ACFQ4C_00440 [Larkinella insperata]|uniref:Uncharacterized protein n=1 Tax=Larkinella insperata TaxID=332158 RepID=A0ABW3Q054_9BACT|nr:hypothetical protein [Larkinella insperata]